MDRTFIRYPLLMAVVFFLFPAAAQTGMHYEGETLAYFLGKSATGSELKDLKADYKCEMANEAHYLSKEGLELVIFKNVLNEIRLYKSSAVYGSYIRKLPKNLKFGITSGDVKHLLGKPAISYNSGYCEYEYSDYILSCWFDGGHLSQVSLSAKTPL